MHLLTDLIKLKPCQKLKRNVSLSQNTSVEGTCTDENGNCRRKCSDVTVENTPKYNCKSSVKLEGLAKYITYLGNDKFRDGV